MLKQHENMKNARVILNKQQQADNNVKDKGALALSEALKVNSKLHTLFLRSEKQQQCKHISPQEQTKQT